MDYLESLTSRFPSFWSDKLQEETAFKTLLKAYSYVYGSAIQKMNEVKNESSPITINAFSTEYYKVINLRETFTPSYSIGDNMLYYEVLYGLLDIERLSNDISFTKSISFEIFFDAKLDKYFIAIPATEISPSDSFLYISKCIVDNKNVVNTYGSLFPGLKPFEVFMKNNVEIIERVDPAERIAVLINQKAQIVNFIRCATNGGSLEYLKDIISVALKASFLEEESVVIGFDQDSNMGYIKFRDQIISTQNLKKRLRKVGSIIAPYEPYEECPIQFFSWIDDPAKFTQAILAHTDWDDLLLVLTMLQPGEKPATIKFDKFQKFDNNLSYDFGNKALTKELFQRLDRSSPYIEIPHPNIVKDIHDFSQWEFETFHPRVYEMFKNVVIYYGAPPPHQGLVNNNNEMMMAVFYSWLQYNLLDYFRPLHMKYTFIPMSQSKPPS